MDNTVHVPRLQTTPSVSTASHYSYPTGGRNISPHNKPVGTNSVLSSMPSPYVKQTDCKHNTTPDSQRGIRVVGSNSPSQSELCKRQEQYSQKSQQQQNNVTNNSDPHNIQSETPYTSKALFNFHMPNFLIQYGNEITILCFFLLIILVVYETSWRYATTSMDATRRNASTQKIFRAKLKELEGDTQHRSYQQRLEQEKYTSQTISRFKQHKDGWSISQEIPTQKATILDNGTGNEDDDDDDNATENYANNGNDDSDISNGIGDDDSSENNNNQEEEEEEQLL
jgi:hypothetical protein